MKVSVLNLVPLRHGESFKDAMDAMDAMDVEEEHKGVGA